MSSALRNDRTEGETKALLSAAEKLQLIAFARLLARQAAREALAAKNSPDNQDLETGSDGHA